MSRAEMMDGAAGIAGLRDGRMEFCSAIGRTRQDGAVMADENAGVRPTQTSEDRVERIRKLAQAISGQPYRAGGGDRDQAAGSGGSSSAEKPSD